MGSENITSVLYVGNTCMGEMSIHPQCHDASLISMISKKIKISHLSCPSQRYPPLVVLHYIASSGVCLKMEPKEQHPHHDHSNLDSLYNECLKEAKTAIVPLGGNELHMVAMRSRDRKNQVPCFWGFIVAVGLYASCLRMLNLKCLAVVFDLDETLVVANTLRSFKDRIEALEKQILKEVDPLRVAGMSAEIKRYQDDEKILKLFAETDHIYDKGKLMMARPEIVPTPSKNNKSLERPIIRLREQNIILTRIDPNNRDSSVFVRMRPAWEELRNYLTVNGRKRFEVFVCTLSQKDYALEMWRLLDPQTSLISLKELQDRVVCVEACFMKSLLTVFHNGICHPKMAMVIDDRLKVWEDTNQSQVYVVPAFAPYSAPMAETSNPDSILCITKNNVCSVRGRFFKDFDKGFSKRMASVFNETDVTKLPVAPDVSKYLVTEKKQVANENANLPVPCAMESSEVGEKLNLQDKNLLLNNKNREPKSRMQPSAISTAPSIAPTQLCEKALEYSHEIPLVGSSNSQVISSNPCNTSTAGTGEGNMPESEMNQMLKHGQDAGQHGFKSYGPQNHENDQNWSSRETKRSTSVQEKVVKQRTDNGNGSYNPVVALKNLCTKEGLSCHFQKQPSTVLNYHAQVEIDGKFFGKSNGPTWKAAKLKAAEEALKNIKMNLFNQWPP